MVGDHMRIPTVVCFFACFYLSAGRILPCILSCAVAICGSRCPTVLSVSSVYAICRIIYCYRRREMPPATATSIRTSLRSRIFNTTNHHSCRHHIVTEVA
ncbi:hypothetical protein BJY00DRAFT_267360 [Aspergillus carlsbadensis]|nr:hypothetical protein BJY00DRAFT_267360 [Aspergillus carlsbadensis]